MQQEKQLEDIIHNVPGGVCLYRWDGKNLHPLIMSDQFYALLGIPDRNMPVSPIGITFNHTHPDDLPALKQAILQAFNETGKISYSYRSYNDKLQKYLWVHIVGVAFSQDDGTQLAYVSYLDITEEHLITQKLAASEKALDVAADAAGLWYWKFNPTTGRAYYNQEALRQFDLPAEEDNYPQSWLDSGFILPEFNAAYAQAAQQIKDGVSRVVFEAQVKFKDGSVHWGEFRFTNLPQMEGQDRLAVCTARMIDLEKSLLTKYELERQKPSLGEKALLFHAIFNLETSSTTEYIDVEHSQSLAEQYPTLEQVTKHLLTQVVGISNQDKLKIYNTTAYLKEQQKQGNTTFSLDYRRRTANGRILWVRNIFHLIIEPNTKNLLLFEYCYDIHAQKMSDEILSVTGKKDYERIACVDFNNMLMIQYGEYGVLTATQQIDYNESRLDYAKTVVISDEQAVFIDACSPTTVMREVALNKEYVFTTSIRHPDGSSGVIKTRFLPYEEENKIFIMTRTDVTDLLQAEELKNQQLKEALSIAEQANQAKSAFLSAMSHDMRTPLNAIMGMCELAVDDENDKAQIRESLASIQSSSLLLLTLINNILDMSRIENGKMTLNNQKFSLTSELKRTETSFHALAEQKNQHFQMFVNIIHDNCCGDVARIHSALDNVLSNALKYTPSGGKIIYRITETPSKHTNIGNYRFEITDNGIGMDEDTQKHIFEPFYRALKNSNSSVEGTGLGLSIAKAIIDLKGGVISLTSVLGQGTTFVIDLPIPLGNSDTDAVPQNPTLSNLEDYDLSQARILLCEDHPINQKVAYKILCKAGAKVTVASDGKAGSDFFLTSPVGTFNLILMDVRMPIMDGYEATRVIRSSKHPQAKSIPIIAMTANAFAEDVQQSLKAGMNDHLAKPVVPALLYRTILHYLDKTTTIIKKKVLFVDDAELNIAVLTTAINSQYDVLVARNGQEALAVLDANQDIAAIITDIVMPDMDGISLIKKIRSDERYRNIAIIANTQYGDAKQEEELLAIGADDFLYKPTTPQLVRNRLEAALLRYQ